MLTQVSHLSTLIGISTNIWWTIMAKSLRHGVLKQLLKIYLTGKELFISLNLDVFNAAFASHFQLQSCTRCYSKWWTFRHHFTNREWIFIKIWKFSWYKRWAIISKAWWWKKIHVHLNCREAICIRNTSQSSLMTPNWKWQWDEVECANNVKKGKLWCYKMDGNLYVVQHIIVSNTNHKFDCTESSDTF